MQKFKVKRHVIVFSVIAVFFVLFFAFEFTCPIYIFLGIPCPTCGVTRGLLSLLQLDFKSYVNYNAMAPFLFISVILMYFRRKIKHKRTAQVFVITVISVNSVYYIIRLMGIL